MKSQLIILMIKAGSIYSRRMGSSASVASSTLSANPKNYLKSTSDERETPHSSMILDANEEWKENRH
jgi:hypothetical protein